MSMSVLYGKVSDFRGNIVFEIVKIEGKEKNEWRCFFWYSVLPPGLIILVINCLNKVSRQDYVVYAESRAEQRGYFSGRESGYAAAYARHQKCLLRMRLGVFDELVNVRGYFVHTSVHGGYGIALALHTDALSHDGAEIADCRTSGSAAVHPGQIAAEDEDFFGLECGDVVGCVSSCRILSRSVCGVIGS